VLCFNVDHGDTSRTLDFQRTNNLDSSQRSTCMRPILEEEAEAMARNDADVDKDSPDQVSLKFQLVFLVL
jgi:hypothetical protein